MDTGKHGLRHGVIAGEIVIEGDDGKASGQKIIIPAQIDDNHHGQTECPFPVGADIRQQIGHHKKQNAVGGKAERLHDNQTETGFQQKASRQLPGGQLNLMPQPHHKQKNRKAGNRCNHNTQRIGRQTG